MSTRLKLFTLYKICTKGGGWVFQSFQLNGGGVVPIALQDLSYPATEATKYGCTNYIWETPT